jgi:hypothetical protein
MGYIFFSLLNYLNFMNSCNFCETLYSHAAHIASDRDKNAPVTADDLISVLNTLHYADTIEDPQLQEMKTGVLVTKCGSQLKVGIQKFSTLNVIAQLYYLASLTRN